MCCRFYGRNVSPIEILGGEIPRPRAAQILYDALDTAMSTQPYAKYSFNTMPPFSTHHSSSNISSGFRAINESQLSSNCTSTESNE